ncbi:MAG: hypothetical protein JWR54_591 [Mucilaginibacter sp.]|nr:hypothetical protein [Mucilaginibacter sp.]
MDFFTQLKRNIGFKYRRLEANINKAGFFVIELIRAFFFQEPKMRILFSENSDREPNIRKGFHYLRHQIDFKAFTPENIKKNDLIVPLCMSDLRSLEQVRDLIKNNPIPIPSLLAIDICDDKYLFSKTLDEKGFGYATPKIGKNLPYPYMLKKKVAQSGDNCYIIANPEQEEEFENVINDPDYFCQEMIQGTDEYATHISFKDYKIVSCINIKYVFPGGTFVKGKDKFICTKISKCPYLDLFSSILIAIEYEGLCCFNYKVIDGKPLILEINPRFGGSLSTFFFSFIRQLDWEKTPQAKYNLKSS